MHFLILQNSPKIDAPDFEYTIAKGVKRALEKLGHKATITGPGHPNFFNPNVQLEDMSLVDIRTTNKFDIVLLIENYWDHWLPDLSQNKAYKMMWVIDAHCISMTPFLKEFERSKYNLILQTTYDFLTDAPNQIWFPCSFDPTMVYPLACRKIYPIGFCGNLHNRNEPIQLLKDNGIDVHLDLGHYGQKQVEAINSYKIHLNRNIRNDINIRNFETIGCSTMLLTSYNPHYGKIGFKEGINFEMYKTSNELLEKAKFYIDHIIKINHIANAGYEQSKKHTFEERFKKLLHHLKGTI